MDFLQAVIIHPRTGEMRYFDNIPVPTREAPVYLKIVAEEEYQVEVGGGESTPTNSFQIEVSAPDDEVTLIIQDNDGLVAAEGSESWRSEELLEMASASLILQNFAELKHTHTFSVEEPCDSTSPGVEGTAPMILQYFPDSEPEPEPSSSTTLTEEMPVGPSLNEPNAAAAVAESFQEESKPSALSSLTNDTDSAQGLQDQTKKLEGVKLSFIDSTSGEAQLHPALEVAIDDEEGGSEVLMVYGTATAVKEPNDEPGGPPFRIRLLHAEIVGVGGPEGSEKYYYSSAVPNQIIEDMSNPVLSLAPAAIINPRQIDGGRPQITISGYKHDPGLPAMGPKSSMDYIKRLGDGDSMLTQYVTVSKDVPMSYFREGKRLRGSIPFLGVDDTMTGMTQLTLNKHL